MYIGMTRMQQVPQIVRMIPDATNYPRMIGLEGVWSVTEDHIVTMIQLGALYVAVGPWNVTWYPIVEPGMMV